LKRILCIGEIVWDEFPDEMHLGGAPFNVAYHLNSLGFSSIICSKVGHDELGLKTLKKINQIGMEDRFVQIDKKYPTGKVLIKLHSNGNATFETLFPAAWDFINIDSELKKAGNLCDYIVYGTVAQREKKTKSTIQKLRALNKINVYDVNLRPPHIDREIIHQSLNDADIIKMNFDEFYQICKWFNFSQNLKEGIRELTKQYNCNTICVTLGSEGSVLYHKNLFVVHPGYKVNVIDTVGAGDAFLAGLLTGIIQEKNINEILELANRIGAYVATKKGASPKIDLNEFNLINTLNN